METLKYVIISLCFGWLVAGVVNILAPDGGIGRTVRLTLSVFTLAVLIIPFSNTYDLSDLWQFETKPLQTETFETPTQSMESAAKEEVIAVVSNVAEVKRISIEVEHIETHSSQGKIWIDSLVLQVVGTKKQGSEVEQTIKQQIDTDITVYVTEEEKASE